MPDWNFAQQDPAEQLCSIQYFSMKKKHASGKGEVEIVITLREYVNPPDPAMKFLAQADKEVNQGGTAYKPVGWGPTLLRALSECMNMIRRFPYEGPV